MESQFGIMCLKFGLLESTDIMPVSTVAEYHFKSLEFEPRHYPELILTHPLLTELVLFSNFKSYSHSPSFRLAMLCLDYNDHDTNFLYLLLGIG